MGKAAKFKKLRKLALQLPAVNVKTLVGEKMKGYQLPKDAKIEGDKDVVPGQMYMRKKVIEVPLNHERKLKEAYKKHGLKGAAGYAQAVIRYTEGKAIGK